MGFDKTRGLGVNKQGPTELIEESKQKGRRGLGFTFKEFNEETAEWDFDNDPVNTFLYFIYISCYLLYRHQ
jgi:G-patch protein